jgi:hypothetical protein
MDTRARLPLPALRVAMMAALGALLFAFAAPAEADAAKKKRKKLPTISDVQPLQASVGDTLTLRGKYYRRGKGRNSVVFKAVGKRAYFVTADISTRRMLEVVVPKRLEEAMLVQAGKLVPTKFRLRVQSSRLGKRYTALDDSPTIGPEQPESETPGDPTTPPAGPPPADGDCDGDGVVNGTDADDDGDLLPDTLEATLKLNQCDVDTDGDGVQDGYEYKSGVDLNDDEYKQPDETLPSPDKRPYPNPLDAEDADSDYDGDGLTLREEFELWVYTMGKGAPQTLFPLTYSDGEQYSASRRCAAGDASPLCGGNDSNRRIPTLAAAGYDRFEDFLGWAGSRGYRTVELQDGSPWFDHATVRNGYGLLDFDRDGDEETSVQLGYWTSERYYYDFDDDGYLSDDERDEDADGLTNHDELHGRMLPEYWKACYDSEPAYQIAYRGTSHVDADSDGDGIRDGADDQDHDDVPNVMELSRVAASGLYDGQRICQPADGLPTEPDTHHPAAYGFVNPYNPCLPAEWSRTCQRHPQFDDMSAPFKGPYWWSLQ